MSALFKNVLAAVLICAGDSALAQAWPSKPVRLMLQVGAGSVTDIVGRMYADQMSRATGQPWVIDNRPGAEGMIATEAVARAAPDGYTLLLSSQTIVINPYTMKNLSVNPAQELVPVATVVDSAPFALVANTTLPARTLGEMLALARQQPGKLTYGITVPISGMFGQLLAKRAGVELLEVPYKTTQQALQDVLSGEVRMYVTSLPGMAEHVRSGKLRVLAVTSAARLKGWEDVETVGETFPGFQMNGWVVVMAPRGTPAEIVERINREADPIVRNPQFVERMQQWGWQNLQGARTVRGTGEFIRSESERWGQIIKTIGIVPQ